MFRPGMRVVCIKDNWKNDVAHNPKKFQIKVVKQVVEDKQGTFLHFYSTPGDEYTAKAFRPIDDPKSIQMLLAHQENIRSNQIEQEHKNQLT